MALARLPGSSPTAEAIRYALNHQAGLVRFLDDGRIEMDSNTVERAIRPLCLSRKNALFASGDDGGARWAAIASLVETCKLNVSAVWRPYAAALDVCSPALAQHHGMSSSMRLLGQPLTSRVSRSVK